MNKKYHAKAGTLTGFGDGLRLRILLQRARFRIWAPGQHYLLIGKLLTRFSPSRYGRSTVYIGAGTMDGIKLISDPTPPVGHQHY